MDQNAHHMSRMYPEVFSLIQKAKHGGAFLLHFMDGDGAAADDAQQWLEELLTYNRQAPVTTMKDFDHDKFTLDSNNLESCFEIPES